MEARVREKHMDIRYKVLWIGEIAKHKGIGETKVLQGKKKAKVLWIYWLLICSIGICGHETIEIKSPNRNQPIESRWHAGTALIAVAVQR